MNANSLNPGANNTAQNAMKRRNHTNNSNQSTQEEVSRHLDNEMQNINNQKTGGDFRRGNVQLNKVL